jgi:hypothetical protein
LPKNFSVKLSTFTGEPNSQASTKQHLLCLNQQEALMLFGLLQAALRHEPTRRSLLSSGDYKHFHRQLSQSLAQGLAQPIKG